MIFTIDRTDVYRFVLLILLLISSVKAPLAVVIAWLWLLIVENVFKVSSGVEEGSLRVLHSREP
jgi:hypothetical protein